MRQERTADDHIYHFFFGMRSFYSGSGLFPDLVTLEGDLLRIPVARLGRIDLSFSLLVPHFSGTV